MVIRHVDLYVYLQRHVVKVDDRANDTVMQGIPTPNVLCKSGSWVKSTDAEVIFGAS